MKIDTKKLATFIPLSSLNIDNLKEISTKSIAMELVAGKSLFKQGDKDKFNYYLVSGKVQLFKNNQVLETIKDKDDKANQALVNQKPRTATAKTKTTCIIYRVNSDLLDIMLTWDQTGSYSVDELQVEDESNDWMTKVLQTKAFMKIPPANIQEMFMKMESVSFKTGDQVIKQNDLGDYFYIISEGRAMVTRATPSRPKGIKLAELKAGDSFGEEALISDNKRNATVVMLSKGTLMRLSKKDFMSLLVKPLLTCISYPDAVKMLVNGAVCIDVRLPSEYRVSHLKDAQNIPLVFLRMRLKTFSPLKKYIVYCDTGSRSSVAAHLMTEKGLDVKVIKNGTLNIPEVALKTQT